MNLQMLRFLQLKRHRITFYPRQSQKLTDTFQAQLMQSSVDSREMAAFRVLLFNKEDQADKRTSKVRLESRELKRSSDLFLLVYFGFNNSDLDYPILYKMQTESSAGAPQPSSFEQISDPDIDEIKRSFQVREMYMVMKSLI